MSSVSQQMNSLLNPFLFQVIGSTPTSIRDSIKDAGLKGKATEGLGLATVCVFAAAVNKATLETFLVKPELDFARRVVMANFTVSGKVNMTGITLLGHCLFTTSAMDGVTFVKEFRNKMGQDHIWNGEMKSGSLSEKQREILSEKKRLTEFTDAKLLGSGFFKFCGIDSSAMTQDEQNFWGETMTGASNADVANPFMQFQAAQTSRPRAAPQFVAQQDSGPSPPRSSGIRSPTVNRTAQHTPSASRASDDYREFTLPNGAVVSLLVAAVEYYLSQNDGNEQSMFESVARRGPEQFNTIYGTAATRGLQSAATVAGSVRNG